MVKSNHKWNFKGNQIETKNITIYFIKLEQGVEMLVFIDESGHPRPNDNTNRPVLLGVCIKETNIRELTSRIYKIKMEIYNKSDVEVKATNLITRRIFFKNLTRNKEFVDKIMDLVFQIDLNVFAIIMEKPDVNPYFKEGILPKQYFYMLKRIELYCQNHQYPMAMVIFDEQDRNEDQKISVAFNNFLFQSALGKSFEKILEIPLFVNSQITPGIQLADLMAGIVRHYYEEELYNKKPEDQFQEWIDKLFNTIKHKTENLREKNTGFKEYGLFTMSKSKFSIRPEDMNKE